MMKRKLLLGAAAIGTGIAVAKRKKIKQAVVAGARKVRNTIAKKRMKGVSDTFYLGGKGYEGLSIAAQKEGESESRVGALMKQAEFLYQEAHKSSQNPVDYTLSPARKRRLELAKEASKWKDLHQLVDKANARRLKSGLVGEE